MADKTISSSIFRVSYATLDEPVAVTVLGRVIGRWVPVGSPVTPRTPDDVGLTADPPSAGSGVVRTTESAPEPSASAAALSGAGNGSMSGISEFRPYSKTRQAKGK